MKKKLFDLNKALDQEAPSNGLLGEKLPKIEVFEYNIRRTGAIKGYGAVVRGGKKDVVIVPDGDGLYFPTKEEAARNYALIEECGLSVRPLRILQDIGIKRISDLSSWTRQQIARERKWGRICFLELDEAMRVHKVNFKKEIR